jgi:outer membrane protein TolC
VAQPIALVDSISYSAMPALGLEETLRRGQESRADFQAVLARVRAAEADHRSAQAEALPSIHVNADYGAIGANPGDVRQTYSVVGAVRVPVFDAGRRRGRLLETEAILSQRRAEALDFAQRVEADIRGAFLDLQSAEQEVQVAQSLVGLASQELNQARTRSSAGVTSNLEVVQAQEAVATASENQIASLYAYGVAKAALARAIGTAESAYPRDPSGRSRLW